MIYFLIGAAVLHAAFMVAELFPWQLPVLLRMASKGLPKGEPFTSAQQTLVATIVHNAGIYNGILAGGLFWAAFRGDPAFEVARVMLFGALVAGVFGTATMKSPVTAVQAVVGLVGLVLIAFR
jgi:putative membrane protein